MKSLIVTFFMLVPMVAAATEQAKATKVSMADSSAKTCIHQEKTYSVGTVLKNGSVTLECVKASGEDLGASVAVWQLKSR